MAEELQEQTELQVYNPQELQLDEQDDLIVKIKLPTYADVTDDKVIRSIRDVFHGFTFNAADDFGKQFVDPDQLVEYIQQTVADINEHQKIGTVAKITNTSASLARFWVMGYIVDRAITQSTYGNGACQRIAKAINRSVPYVYQLRSVGTRLTLQDCFLLGMREGCNTTTLRRLAQIRDQDRCRQIITAFIDATQNTEDIINIERATKAFKQAILQALKPQNQLDEATTNPADVSEDLASLVSEEYATCANALARVMKETKYLSIEDNIVQLCDALDNFYIMPSVPDAQSRLDELKAKAEEAQERLKTAMEYMGDFDDAIDRLLHVEVLDEGAKRKRSR